MCVRLIKQTTNKAPLLFVHEQEISFFFNLVGVEIIQMIFFRQEPSSLWSIWIHKFMNNYVGHTTTHLSRRLILHIGP